MTPLLRRVSVLGDHFRAACPRSCREQKSCFFLLESEPRVVRSEGRTCRLRLYASFCSSFCVPREADMNSILYELVFVYGVLIAVGLFFGMLTLLEVGRRIGVRRIERDAEGLHAGAIEGSVLALLGLLLAFTISGAGGRLDARRQLIIEETNAIGTAYLRLDMLPSAAQPALRENF